MTKKEKIEKRWYRWDTLMIEENYINVIKEFDEMVKNNEQITVGDLIRREQALESIGVLSLSNVRSRNN